MSINWDDFGDEGETATGAGGQQLCPEGVHVAKIDFVKIEDKEWAECSANKSGTCLVIRMDVSPDIKKVYDTIPCHQRGRIEALCRSARVDPPRGEWNERELKGQMVTFESVLALSKGGKEFVKIDSYKPNAEPLPKEIRERPPVARTATQKADKAAAMPSDDIPF